MLREDYVTQAAKIHVCGARTLRDGAAALICGCTLKDVETAFVLYKLLADAESILAVAVDAAPGLLSGSDLTRYTPVIEARMKLYGVEIDCSVTQNQTAAEKIKSVPPGTRADIFDCYKKLSSRASAVALTFADVCAKIIKNVSSGKSVTAVPLQAVEFISRAAADYAVAAQKLGRQECACLMRRTAEFEEYRICLAMAAQANGVAALNCSCDSLTAMAASGLIPNVAPCLYDILLRYERMPATVSGENAKTCMQ